MPELVSSVDERLKPPPRISLWRPPDLVLFGMLLQPLAPREQCRALPDGQPAVKANLRKNLAAARDEIETLQVAKTVEPRADTETVDAAQFGSAAVILIRCTSDAEVTITFSADVPEGKGLHLVQWGLGGVVVSASIGASLRGRAAAAISTTETYDSLVLAVARNSGGAAAEWLAF